MIGVYERINIDDWFITVGELIPNEIGADKARAAGDKYGHMCKSRRGGRSNDAWQLPNDLPFTLKSMFTAR